MAANNTPYPSPQAIRDALKGLEGATSLDAFVERAYLDTIRAALPKDITRPEWLRKSQPYYQGADRLEIDDSAGDQISINHVSGQVVGYIQFEVGEVDEEKLIDFDRDTADRLKVIHGAIGAWLESNEAYIAYVDSL